MLGGVVEFDVRALGLNHHVPRDGRRFMVIGP